MANVVAIIKDDRVRRQVEQFLQQLGMDDLRFATFANHQEFSALYFRDRKNAPPPDPEAKSDEVEIGDLKLFSEIHLLIFALDSIGEKSNAWLNKTKKNLIQFQHWPQAAPMRTVMLKYEDDGISKLDVLHPLLDDLIYLPLDRLVFLQKAEILLNLPMRVKPKFLFNQEVKQTIEISKITRLERLSDVGLAIRNPMPLKKGLPGHFYIHLPGEKTRLELRAKVLRSEPHPEFPGQYLVYFTYFALPKTSLSRIRQALSKSPRYQSLISDDRSAFRARPGDLFAAEEDLKQFGVAVVDPDDQLAGNLATQIGKDMDRLKIIAESSYNFFLHKYFETTGGLGDKIPPKSTDEKDFYRSRLTITLAANDLKCLSLDPGPAGGDKFLGHLAMEVFATPEKWLSMLTDQPSRLILEEAVQFALKGRMSDKVLVLQDSADQRRAVNFRFQKGSMDNLVTAEVTAATLSDIVTKMNSEERNKELDVLIFDSAYAPEDPQGWMDGLRARALQVGLIKNAANLKFFFTTENETRNFATWLNVPDVLGLFVKPVDGRQLLFLLSEYLPNKNTVYHFDNLGWSQPSLNIHVSKNVELEALSEFGATLKSRQPLSAGTILFLRKSIYDNAPNQCLAARVYSCEPHASEKEFFQVYTTYFGINDQFLKFARTWIRENYAHQKGKEST